MKFIEKFLIKRCSTEVQIMLQRMKERPDDFDYGTGWRKLIEIADDSSSPYTSAERRMIRKYWKECKDTRNRNELLRRIMSETINPTTRESIEDSVDSYRYTQALVASMQGTNKHIMNGGIYHTGTTDPRAIFGTTLYTGNGAKNTIQHGLHP